MTAQTIIAGTEAARRVAANREQAIIQALVAYKNQFTTGIPRQVTIRIYNKIITLHGSQAQMSREFKQFVKQQLNASPTSA
jgi:ribosomal protein L6P/L9E